MKNKLTNNNNLRRTIITLIAVLTTCATAWAQDLSNLVEYSEIPTVTGGQSTNWSSTENYQMLVDGNTATKYGLSSNDPWVEFHYAQPFTPVGYALWTANDEEGRRNPTSWTIKAKNADDSDWTTLVSVDNSSNDKLPMANNTETRFALQNSTAYQYFRFEATRRYNVWEYQFQLAELRFLVVDPNTLKRHIANTASDTQMTWDEFATNVSNGVTYQGETVYLDEDITATTKVGGILTLPFMGTFDGQGHTVTFNCGTASYPDQEWFFCAPFQYVEDATFQNLKVTGNIYSKGGATGGIAGITGGNASHFINCESNISIDAQSGGGFVGFVYGGSSVIFDGCVFTGSFYCHYDDKIWAGFVLVIDPDNIAETRFNNCVFAPTEANVDYRTFVGFSNGAQSPSQGDIPYTNCYYTQALDVLQGKQMYSIGTTSYITAAMDGEATVYDVSHITAYSDNQGLVYNNTLIAGEGDNVALNLYGGITYEVSHGTLNGTANPYTLTMAANNTTIAEIPPSPPYSTGFEETCGWTLVNGSCTNAWVWGTAAHNGEGTHCLYISNDGGTTNAYDNTSNTMVYAYKNFNFAASHYNFTYDWNAYGEYSHDFLRVALVPASVSLEAGTERPSDFNYNVLPEGWIALDGGSQLSKATEWQTVSQEIEIATAGSYMMVFAWRNDINGTNPPAAIDNVNIVAVSCLMPTELNCTTFTSTTATLAWTENGEASAWQVCLNDDETNLIDLTENPGILTNLTSLTTYTAKVRSNCGDEQSAWSNSITFTTTMIPVGLPYSTDFETECDWMFVNGDLANAWTWGEAAHNGEGTHGIYISNDGGSTNAYDNTSNTMVYAYKNFNFAASHYNFTYDWKAYGENKYDFLRVALVPASVSLEADTYMPRDFDYYTLPEGWIALDGGSQLNLASGWHTVSQEIEIATAGYYNVVFAWHNDRRGTNPPAAIDNVSIEVATCLTPRNFTVGNITSTTANLNWTGGPETESYTMKYRTISTVFSEEFENGLGDWTLQNCSSSTGISGSVFMFFNDYNSSGNPPQYLISPELTGVTEEYRLDFYYTNFGFNTEESFQVGFSSTSTANVTFTFGEKIIVTDDEQWHLYSTPVPAGTKYICWRYTPNTATSFNLFLDEIKVYTETTAGEWQTATVAGNANEVSTTLTGLTPETQYNAFVYPDCEPNKKSKTVWFTTPEACVTPTDLTVGDVSATTANLNWTGGPETESYTVKYRIPTHFNPVYSEGFEEGAMPQGWTQSGPGTWNVTQGYGFNSIGTHRGTYNVRITHTDRENETFLVSPMLDLSGQNDLFLNFWYINYNWGGSDIDQLYVYYRVNEGSWIELWSTTEDHQAWTKSGTIALPNPSANYQIGFKMIDKYGRGVGIDDIAIGPMAPAGEWQTAIVAGNTIEVSTTLTGLSPETQYEAYAYPDCDPNKKSEIVGFTMGECPIPHNFAVDSLTSTTADLSWTAGSDVENYTVKYRVYQHFRPIYNEGFEYGIDDWTLRNCTGNTGLTTEDAFSGSVAFLFDNNGTTQYLISPELTGIDEEMTLRFYGRHCGHEDVETVYVGFSATNTDNASFNFVEEGIGAFGEWQFIYSVTVPAGTKYICFKRSNDNGCPLFIDDISIGLNVPDGEWQTVSAAGGTYQGNTTLTDLIPETRYQAYVYNDCSAGSSTNLYFTTLEACVTPTDLTVSDVSATTANLSWTGGPETESYTVKYRLSGIVFAESFENGIGDWTLRDCPDNTGINSYTAHSGSSTFCFYFRSNPPQYLISPELTGIAEGMRLEFYYENGSTSWPEAFQVGFSTTDNETASFTFGDQIVASDGRWHRYSEPIPAGTKYICWKLLSTNLYLFIDDIRVGTIVSDGAWQTVTVAGGTMQVSTTLSELTPETPYEAYVYPDCNPDKVSNTVLFSTMEAPLSYYATDFETGCDWTFVNGNLTNAWTWGEATHNGEGTHGLYISNDGGATNTYTNTSTMVYAYKTFLFDTGIYNFAYDWNAYGENNYDFLRVALVPTTVNLEAGTERPSDFNYNVLPEGWIALDGGSQLNQASVWNTMSQEIEIAMAGHYNVVFAWRNDNSVGTNPPAAIDNVSIEVVTCSTPLNFSVSNLTATTADLGWAGSILTDSYTVKYRRSEIIFTEGFEDGIMPSGWTQSGPGTWDVTQGYGFNSIGTHNGTYNATINHTSRGDETFLVTPMLDLSGQSNPCLSFWYINFNWGSADIDQLYVYYRVNEGEWIELWNTTEDHQEWTESGFIPLPNPSANYQIGFKMIDKYGHGVGIDDIAVSSMISAGEWQTATVAGNTIQVSNTLTGLTPSTSYEAFVYPNCNPNKKSEIVGFTTEAGSLFSMTIAGYGTTDGNWHLIASPVTNISPDNVEGMTDGDYDLYRFSPSDVDLEWRNYEAEDVSFNLEAGKGYLYARSTDATLTFVGTPYSGNGEFELVYDANDEHKCWNLVGNPFNCNAYLNKDYYILNAEGTGINPAPVSSDISIPPFTAVFVKAVSAGDKVVFIKHKYVDLGLPSGLLWATCNIGANAPEEYGDYFAWGETQPENTYNWNTYQYCMGSNNNLTKYCDNSNYGYNGFTDGLTTLLPEDDAATANWGNGWRMPTKVEFEELYNNTTVTRTQQNGVNGTLFTAANGNTLFLPAAGYRDGSYLNGPGDWGNYWSSSLLTGSPNYAWYLHFNSDDCEMWSLSRYLGHSVRPVHSAAQH